MNRKYMKFINIILIFVIILVLGVTKSFSASAIKDEIKVSMEQEASSWSSEEIAAFLDEYGGFPKGLPEVVREKWVNILSADSTQVWKVRGEELQCSGEYQAGTGKKVDSILNKYLKKDVNVSDDQLVKAVNKIIDGNLTSEEALYKIEQGEGDEEKLWNEYNETISSEFNNIMAGSNNKIYKQPNITKSETASGSLEDMMSDADAFVATGNTEPISQSDLQSFSNMMYNILLEVGIAVAVIIGGIIGIKFMMASVEEKAQVKELLVPYVVGCVIVFGSFAIWKLAVTLFGSM